MGENSAIQWTTHTFNPWIGCDKVSAGCKNCYAEVETFARISKGRGLPLWGPKAARHRTKTWGDPKRWNRAAKSARLAAEAAGLPYERPRVFCASLCDVFEDRPDLVLDSWRAVLWSLIEDCRELDWMLLTKRPQNIMRMVPVAWVTAWPAHAWIGTSVEDQAAADERIPHLLGVPARVRFLSCEPLLGVVDLSAFMLKHRQCGEWCPACGAARWFGGELHLVIVGGEGHGGRPCDVAWIRSIVRQCKEAGVACFVKQLGASARVNTRPYTAEEEKHTVRYHKGYIPGTGTVEEFLRLKHPKGGDPSEWPADLRVREMPQVSR